MFEKIIDGQYRRPSGLLGRWIGSRMARDHLPENLWTVSVLRANPSDQILELGFGSGAAIQELIRRVPGVRAAGIDFSKTMVGEARRRNAAAVRKGQVELRCGDAAELPFDNDHFDRAYSVHSIYFWPRPLEVLEEVYRVLKPGGLLAVTVLPKERWNAGTPSAGVGTPECIPYSGDELVRMLEGAGFGNVRIEADPDPEKRSSFSVMGEKPEPDLPRKTG